MTEWLTLHGNKTSGRKLWVFFSSFLNVYVYVSWSSWLCVFNKPVKTAVFRSGSIRHGKWGDFYSFSWPAVLTTTGREWLWIAGLGMWDCVFRIWTLALGARGLRRLWAANCTCWRGRDAGLRERPEGLWIVWMMNASVMGECLFLNRHKNIICSEEMDSHTNAMNLSLGDLVLSGCEVVCRLRSLVLRHLRQGLWICAREPVWWGVFVSLLL